MGKHLEYRLDPARAERKWASGRPERSTPELTSTLSDDGADANVQSVTCRRSAMARNREDSHDKGGSGLHWIGEELARRILLVLA